MAKILSIYSVLVLVVVTLPSYVIKSSSPIKITSPVFNGTCPSDAAARELEKLIKKELKNQYGLPCESFETRPTLNTTLNGRAEGSFWDDYSPCHEPNIVGIRSVTVTYDNQINSIQITYLLVDETLYTAPRHGTNHGSSSTFTLAQDERIVQIEGSTDNSVITHLTFITENSTGGMSQHGPYGVTGSTSFDAEGYILSFRGYNSSTVNGLGIYYLQALVKDTNTFGGSCRNTSFDDKVDTLIPPVVGLKQLTIHHADLIDSLQATYILLGGSLHEGKKIGGVSGTSSVVPIGEQQSILGFNFTTSNTFEQGLLGFNSNPPDTFLAGLTVYLLNVNSSSYEYGPYGQPGRRDYTYYNTSGFTLGFYGSSDYYDLANVDVVCRVGGYYVNFLT